jgi:hypothetical protein
LYTQAEKDAQLLSRDEFDLEWMIFWNLLTPNTLKPMTRPSSLTRLITASLSVGRM